MRTPQLCLVRSTGQRNELHFEALVSPSSGVRLFVLLAAPRRPNVEDCKVDVEFLETRHSPFSSSFLAFLNFIHQDARSRFEGGEAAFCWVDWVCLGATATADAWTLLAAMVEAIARV